MLLYILFRILYIYSGEAVASSLYLNVNVNTYFGFPNFSANLVNVDLLMKNER
jgi:hypothetical protein